MNKMNVLRSLTLMSIQVWVLENSIRPREQSLEIMDRIPQTGGAGRGPMMKPPRRGSSQTGSDGYDATMHPHSDHDTPETLPATRTHLKSLNYCTLMRRRRGSWFQRRGRPNHLLWTPLRRSNLVRPCCPQVREGLIRIDVKRERFVKIVKGDLIPLSLQD